jgi:allantoinase
VTPTGEHPATVRARDGVIVEVGPYDPAAGVDCGAAALLPGVVDTHVHLNEPGRTEWEGFSTGTAAAAAGGVTTLVDMPLNSSPVTTTAAALAAKRAAAQGKLHVDVGFYGGLIPGSVKHVDELVDAGVLGIKVFLCASGLDEFPPVTEKELRAVMPRLADRGLPLLVHAELVDEAAAKPVGRRYADYLASRPEEFERRAIALMIELCESTGCRVHVVHLADAGCLPMLAAARARRLPITVETCPHYLTFSADKVAEGATLFKCAPPIRSVEHREGLWDGLRSGVIDLVASDHSPALPELKSLDDRRFDLAWGGISSLQLSLSAVWTEASRRGFQLADVVRWMSAAPARLVGLKRGIQVGAPANLVVFDPEATFVVDASQLLHRHKLTPYHGRRLRGVVRATYVHGKLAAPGVGQLLRT